MVRKIEKFVTDVMEYIGMSLLVLMTVTICFSVFTRYFLDFTPGWSEELALTCMVWFGFLAMAIGVCENLHIGITILDLYLPKRIIYYLEFFKYFAICAFSIFMVTEGAKMTEVAMGNVMPGIGLPSAVLYAVIPLAGMAMIAYSIIGIADLIQGIERGVDK